MGWLKDILQENRRVVNSWPEWKRRAGMSEPTGRELVESNYSRLEVENAQLKAELAQATQREARLREALTETVDKCEDEDWEYMFGDIIARAKQALEEVGT